MSSCHGARRSNPGRPPCGAPPRNAISVLRQVGETCMARCSRHRIACGLFAGTPGQTAMKSRPQAWANAGCCVGLNLAPS